MNENMNIVIIRGNASNYNQKNNTFILTYSDYKKSFSIPVYAVTEEIDDLPKRVYENFKEKSIWGVNVIGCLTVKDGQLQIAALSVSFHKGR